MTEEPFRWLEAVAQRREYVRDQLRDATPVFAVALPEGILLLGVGQGGTKVFEVHDRHALAALGHPSDIERIRQAAIDAAHVEAFTRSAEDLSLRRLVGFGLSPVLKQAFEQLHSAPVLAEFVFAELGTAAEGDRLARLRSDGGFEVTSGVAVAAPDGEAALEAWLRKALAGVADPRVAADRCLTAWAAHEARKDLGAVDPAAPGLDWRDSLAGRRVEAAMLWRRGTGNVRFAVLPEGWPEAR